MLKYKIINQEINYPKEVFEAIKPVNLELFKGVDETLEIFKDVDYKTFRNHPRTMYEMANIRMGEVAFLDSDNYEFEEIYTFMTPSEQKAYDSLPNVFRGYRGYASDKINIDRGFEAQSWTVNKKVAEFFINEHSRKYKNSQLVMFEKIIFKSDVALVLLCRDESEIVLK